jgi:hypothetical protein
MAKRKSKAAPPSPPPLRRRQCGAMAAHFMLLEQYPAFREVQRRLEGDTSRMREMPRDAAPPPIVTIKTIVHVVYNTDQQNISTAQINSQFTAMNKDFRATNSDKGKTPSPWLGLVSDTRVQFKLAQVTRTKTAATTFTTDDAVKKKASGIAPITPKTHLNLWVCPLGGGLLGYAQFPGGPVATDGVVINCQAFGTKGSAQAPFDKGRTATHEIGHYLNLRHIWGDTPDCSGSDMVSDTPNAAGPNFGTPTWPVVTCNNGPNGDMFMNYMDYTDDAAMFMFTSQQVLRMRTTLDTVRSGLK